LSPARRGAKNSGMPTSPNDGKGAAKPHYLGHRERLRARLLGAGAEALSDYELLEFLLFSARPRGDTKPLAKALIARFGSLAGVFGANKDALLTMPGMGEAAAATLIATRAAALHVVRAEIVARPVLSSWQALLDYCTAAQGFAEVEEFRLLFLDRKNVLIADERHQRGTVDHTPAYPREVVKRALDLGASALILLHNHPSGDTTPSRGDVETTKAIARALQAVGIALHDHVIVGRGHHSSLKSLGLI
jgi:DNA repair protein RadC